MIRVQQYCVGIRKAVRDINRSLFGMDRRGINPYASPMHITRSKSKEEIRKEVSTFLDFTHESSEFAEPLKTIYELIDLLNFDVELTEASVSRKENVIGASVFEIASILNKNEKFKDYHPEDLLNGISHYIVGQVLIANAKKGICRNYIGSKNLVEYASRYIEINPFRDRLN